MTLCLNIYGKLSPEEIDKLIAEYGLRPETAILLKQDGGANAADIHPLGSDTWREETMLQT